MPTRRDHDAAFKANVALDSVQGKRRLPQLSVDRGLRPAMIHQWKLSMWDGARGRVESGGKEGEGGSGCGISGPPPARQDRGDRTAKGAASTTSWASVSDTARPMNALLARLETGSQVRGRHRAPGRLLQPVSLSRCPWGPTAPIGLRQRHRNRSAGATNSLSQRELDPKIGESLKQTAQAVTYEQE